MSQTTRDTPDFESLLGRRRPRETDSAPPWFARFVRWLTGITVLVFGAALSWAINVDRTVTQIRAHQEGSERVREIEIRSIRERLDRSDADIGDLQDRRRPRSTAARDAPDDSG